MEDNDRRKEVMRLAIKHRAPIWAFVLGLVKNPVAAEDLMQETYLVICEKWEIFRPGTNFLAWARQIARYEFLRTIEPARHPLVTVEAQVLETALNRVDESSEEHALRRAALARCMQKIQGTRGGRAVELRYKRGLSCRQVAEQLSVSLEALYKLLSRVRESLQKCTRQQLQSAEV